MSLHARCSCLLILTCWALRGAGADESTWRQVHPRWRHAYVLSFRSPDLLSEEADERWGEEDGRLVSGGLLTDLPAWLREQAPAAAAARTAGRPVLLSLHLHSGCGAGLVTYRLDLRRAEAATYPWLVRELQASGFGEEGVTVAVDTCNAQATAARQLRPDLVPGGVSGWAPFRRWRSRDRSRLRLPLAKAYRVFTQDHVRPHLVGDRSREHVAAQPLVPLTAAERRRFRARLFGPRGVIFATPALFNLLRLGDDLHGTLTADLLRDRLDPRDIDGLLAVNLREFRVFRQFEFLAAAGLGSAEAAEGLTEVGSSAPGP